jgi:hypothetical protein
MILTEAQLKELEEAAKPLVKFLNTLGTPYVTVVVEPTGCELLAGCANVKIEEFLKD